MDHAKRIDKASSVFFFVGFVIAQLRHTPVWLLTAFANISSLFLYFIAYMLWLIACQLYPDHPGLKEHWYGFAQFKNQHRAAAILGTIGIICSVLAFFFPVAVLPACWFFALSSCVWLISEYHKKQNPLAYEDDYSTEQHHVYLRYGVVVTTMALITALATTILIFFPIVALPTLTITTILGICLGSFALHDWVDFTFTDYKPDKERGSYNRIRGGTLWAEQKVYRGANEEIEIKTLPPFFCIR